MSDSGRKLLKDLAAQVRAKTTPAGEPALNKRGLDAIASLSSELSGPDGMPGIRVWKDSQAKLRLERPPRNATITLEWQRDIGALVVTAQKHGEPLTLTRYVFDEGKDHWRPMEGGGELYADVTAALVEYLYPEGKRG